LQQTQLQPQVTVAANKGPLDHRALREMQDQTERQAMMARQERTEPMQAPTTNRNRYRTNANAFPDQANQVRQAKRENLAKTENQVRRENPECLVQMEPQEKSQASQDPQVNRGQKGHPENLEK
jgi:hypothetical protein